MGREERIEEARRLRQEGKRLKEIAICLGVSVATASVYCRGVYPRGTPPPDPRKAKSLEVVQELYPQGIPVTEIAERIGVPVATLYDWMREASFSSNSRQAYVTDDLRERIRQKTSTDPGGALREEAARLYIDEQWSTTEIGERLGVSAVTIGQWLEQEGIKRRQQPTARVREKLRLANLGPKRYNWKGGITPDQIRIRCLCRCDWPVSRVLSAMIIHAKAAETAVGN